MRLAELIDIWLKDHPALRDHFCYAADPDDEFIGSKCGSYTMSYGGPTYIETDRCVAYLRGGEIQIFLAADPEFFPKLEAHLQKKHNHGPMTWKPLNSM